VLVPPSPNVQLLVETALDDERTESLKLTVPELHIVVGEKVNAASR